jgi:hypothetical protein
LTKRNWQDAPLEILIHDIVAPVAGQDFPVPTILQNGAVKLVVAQTNQKSEDAALIAAIARGTCWFEELTSGKALSISGIATREKLTQSYVSRLLNLALLDPALIARVLGGDPSANKVAIAASSGRGIARHG